MGIPSSCLATAQHIEVVGALGCSAQLIGSSVCINTLRLRQNGCRFADDTFKCIFLNENVIIPIKTSLKFVPKDSMNNISALVQIMAWRRPGDKPICEPMTVSLLTHICVTRPQWVNTLARLDVVATICVMIIIFQGLIYCDFTVEITLKWKPHWKSLICHDSQHISLY